MTVNNGVNVMAGLMIIIGLTGAQLTGQIDITHFGWLWLVAFVGINLFQSGFTGICPAKKVLAKLGLKDSNGSCCK